MKALILLATIVTCLGLDSMERIHVPPEARLALSKLSKHILLVEIEAVERKPPNNDQGLEFSKLVIKARVIEVIRGDGKKGQEIEYSDMDVKVIDRKELARSLGDTDIFDGPPASKETGSEECKVGERHVMLYAFGKAYFVRVPKGDESWRSRIKKLAD